MTPQEQLKQDRLKRLTDATAWLAENPLDFARYYAWRVAAIEAGRLDLAGIQIGDKAEVKFTRDDPWNFTWNGTVATVDGDVIGVKVENNRIRLRAGKDLDLTKPVPLNIKQLRILEPVRGIWPEGYVVAQTAILQVKEEARRKQQDADNQAYFEKTEQEKQEKALKNEEERKAKEAEIAAKQEQARLQEEQRKKDEEAAKAYHAAIEEAKKQEVLRKEQEERIARIAAKPVLPCPPLTKTARVWTRHT